MAHRSVRGWLLAGVVVSSVGGGVAVLTSAPTTPDRAESAGTTSREGGVFAPRPPAPELTLPAETALLDSARASLAANQPGLALATLDRYRTEFPTGALADSAAALRAEALARVRGGD